MNQANYPYLKKFCPHCKKECFVVKNGSKREHKYFKCKECNTQFANTTTKKTYSKAIKFLAVELHRYSQNAKNGQKISYTSIATILKIKYPSLIFYWDMQQDSFDNLNKQELDNFNEVANSLQNRIVEIENKLNKENAISKKVHLDDTERLLYYYREDILGAIKVCTSKLKI